MGLWRPIRTLETNTPKRRPFHYSGQESKSRKSRNTWSNRQIWPWSTELSRAKANIVLPRKHTGHSKHSLPTTQEDSTHGHHQMVNTEIRFLYFLQPMVEKLYTVSKNKTRSWLWLRSWTPSYFRLILKKVGKTTRPFRYDLNQIPYDYIEEMTNRFKGLDLIDCLKNYGQVCDIVQEAVIKTILKKKKWKRQRRKGKINPSECKVPNKSKER